jgi:hypothetical protein
MNNKIILQYIKSHLGQDLNDHYDELGCAQTVNNILRNCLGYEAGGGPSTAKMYEALKTNTNFKQVNRNEAQAGDIILSPTGQGNGKIAHGHTGFLGEKGVIYSNNSAKDILDDHLTAQDWKSYFVLKGGYPVYYYRAIGESKTDYQESKVPVILQSSQDINKISLTVKSVIPLLVSLLASEGIVIPEEH